MKVGGGRGRGGYGHFIISKVGIVIIQYRCLLVEEYNNYNDCELSIVKVGTKFHRTLVIRVPTALSNQTRILQDKQSNSRAFQYCTDPV